MKIALALAGLATAGIAAQGTAVPPAGSRPPHLVLVGDSTVTDGAGWGLGFRQLVAAGVRVTNTAQNGAARRASATFPAK